MQLHTPDSLSLYSRCVIAVKHETREVTATTGHGKLSAMPQPPPHPLSPDAIGRRLAAVRLALGMSQAAFAARASIAQNAYNQYESGRRRPQLEAAYALCDAYGITLDWIYRGDASSLPLRLVDKMDLTRHARRS